MKNLVKRLRIIVFLCLCSHFSFSQQSGALYEVIAKMDSLYFSAQNECDLQKYESYLSEDFEFFHDKAGFTKSLKNEMADMEIFCGEQRKRQPLRREMVDNTLKVHPMDNYGALELCDHVFYLQINDGTEKLVGKGKLSAIWKKKGGTWKLARVISYDHQPLAEVELPPEVLKKYVGGYVLPDRIVNIKIEGKLLRVTDMVKGKSGWTKELFPEAKNLFYLNYENVQYEFLDNKKGKAILNIYENGKKIEEALKQH